MTPISGRPDPGQDRQGRRARRRRVRRGAVPVLLLVPAAVTLAWPGGGRASAATLTVCPSGCQFSQIGDTRLAPIFAAGS